MRQFSIGGTKPCRQPLIPNIVLYIVLSIVLHDYIRRCGGHPSFYDICHMQLVIAKDGKLS